MFVDSLGLSFGFVDFFYMLTLIVVFYMCFCYVGGNLGLIVCLLRKRLGWIC